MIEILFLPIAALIALPGLPFLPALVIVWCAKRRWKRAGKGSRVVLAWSAVVWILFAIYETRMYFWMKTVIAPIRVDLLLIAPILYAAALATAIVCWRTRGGRRTAGDGTAGDGTAGDGTAGDGTAGG